MSADYYSPGGAWQQERDTQAAQTRARRKETHTRTVHAAGDDWTPYVPEEETPVTVATKPSIHVYDFEQRSEEWYDARRGIVTASMVGKLISISPADPTCTDCDVCGATAGNPCLSVARKEPTPIKVPHDRRALAAATLPPVISPAITDTAKMLTALLVAERITGWSDPVFTTNNMLRGILDEPIARESYSKAFCPPDAPVVEVGFIVRDDWGFSIGYSPDGLVGDDGLIEIKSRLSRIQLTSILAGEVPAENMAQIQTGLLVTGRKWCDYVSFCGGMPLWPKRVYPDPEWQAAIVAAVRQFEENAAAMIADYYAAVEGLPMTERVDHFQDDEIRVA